ncbi:MAG TPA: hypothetical protein VFL62_14010 [Bradyrhizobium sp.]|uniref:hypothetical protein n=1 Tax=Bradyrhizobium sp. TaxID=376 RepID=UPI002D80C759|nr:hypothetical protein [Bradyrhizobium sp.]HET7887339.1 hypothetical protein [Bradyrhizobium sp.]
MSEAMRAATHARHYAEPPQQTDADGTRHWITRAANFLTVVSQAEEGAVLPRDNPDEYVVLLPPGTAATIEAGGERIESKGNSLTIVPPGVSRVTVRKAGVVARIFSKRAEDLAKAAVNAATYADGAPEVADLKPWPDPVGGFRLRHYDLDKAVSPDPSPLGMRVFRSTNLMINVLMPWQKRRDETKLSPHSHEDFEQISLSMKGAFAHHLRYPWGSDKTRWREDEHARYDASPSVLVIPARVLHTTQDLGEGITWLIDVFGPPRMDFSSREGFVLNAAEYPMPTAT